MLAPPRLGWRPPVWHTLDPPLTCIRRKFTSIRFLSHNYTDFFAIWKNPTMLHWLCLGYSIKVCHPTPLDFLRNNLFCDIAFMFTFARCEHNLKFPLLLLSSRSADPAATGRTVTTDNVTYHRNNAAGRRATTATTTTTRSPNPATTAAASNSHNATTVTSAAATTSIPSTAGCSAATGSHSTG